MKPLGLMPTREQLTERISELEAELSASKQQTSSAISASAETVTVDKRCCGTCKLFHANEQDDGRFFISGLRGECMAMFDPGKVPASIDWHRTTVYSKENETCPTWEKRDGG